MIRGPWLAVLKLLIRSTSLPQEQVRYAATALPILLRKDLHHRAKRTRRKRATDLLQVCELVRPVQTNHTSPLLAVLLPHSRENGFGIAIADLVRPRVDLAHARRVESVCVQVQRTCLELRLEDVGDVDEQHVVEEVCEQRAQHPAFAMVAFPA